MKELLIIVLITCVFLGIVGYGLCLIVKAIWDNE